MTEIISSSSENARVVADAGAIPIFVHLTSNTALKGDNWNRALQEQAARALGKFACDLKCRDMLRTDRAVWMCLSAGISLTEEVKPSLTMVRISIWSLRKLCPLVLCHTTIRFTSPRLHCNIFAPLLASLLVRDDFVRDDAFVLSEACSILASICAHDGLTGSSGVKMVLDLERAYPGIRRRFVVLASQTSRKQVHVKTNALHLVFNILKFGNDEHVQMMLEVSVLSCLRRLLDDYDSNTNTVNRTFRALSNIAIPQNGLTPLPSRIQPIFDDGVLLSRMVGFLEGSSCQVPLKTICDLLSEGTLAQIKALVNHGCVEALSNLLGVEQNSHAPLDGDIPLLMLYGNGFDGDEAIPEAALFGIETILEGHGEGLPELIAHNGKMKFENFLRRRPDLGARVARILDLICGSSCTWCGAYGRKLFHCGNYLSHQCLVRYCNEGCCRRDWKTHKCICPGTL